MARGSWRLAGFAIALFLGGSAAAEAHDMDGIFSRYHMAIRAAEACRGAVLKEADWRTLSAYIDKKTHFELGAGWRLSLIEGAKIDTRLILFYQGCESERAQSLLALYDSELAPLIR